MASDLTKLRAERERIEKRIRDIEKRTGEKLRGRPAAKTISRGATLLTGKSPNRTVIQKKPTSVIGVVTGRETRLKVKRAVK